MQTPVNDLKATCCDEADFCRVTRSGRKAPNAEETQLYDAKRRRLLERKPWAELDGSGGESWSLKQMKRRLQASLLEQLSEGMVWKVRHSAFNVSYFLGCTKIGSSVVYRYQKDFSDRGVSTESHT